MEKEFVPYEQALELKELGFDEPCIAFYLEKVLTFHTHGIDPHFIFKKNSNLWYSSSAPTYSQAFKWFREKCLLEGTIEQADDFYWYKFSVYFYGKENKQLLSKGLEFKTYEEAELACLTKLIEIIKEK